MQEQKYFMILHVIGNPPSMSQLFLVLSILAKILERTAIVAAEYHLECAPSIT